MEQAYKEPGFKNLDHTVVNVLHLDFEKHRDCFRTHWHDRFEFILVKQGEIVICYNDSEFILKAGEMAIIPSETIHRGYTKDCAVSYSVLMFDFRDFYNSTVICREKLADAFYHNVEFNRISTAPEIIDVFNKIIYSNKPLKTVSLVYEMIYLLFEKELDDIKPIKKNNVKKIIKHIESHYTEDVTTAELSQLFGYTEEYFCRKFKESTGITPMKYLKIFRLETAYKLLKTNEYNINELALMCGFNDPNYFTRCFKSHFGHPPSYYKTKKQ